MPFFRALLLSLLAHSWAQTSPAELKDELAAPAVPAPAPADLQVRDSLDITAPTAPAPAQDGPGYPESPMSKSEVEADVAMAESAAVAKSEVDADVDITGVPTAAPPVATSGHTNAHMHTTTPMFTAETVGYAAGALHQAATFPPTTAAEPQDCKVLSGTVGTLMQALLFVCSIAALVFKFRRESGDRTPAEFVMDSSKQLVGAGWIHVLNLSFAKGLEKHFQTSPGSADECQWYFLNIILDCTLGVAVEYVLMRILTVCIQRTFANLAQELETGHYRRQDGTCNPLKYLKQLLMWLIVVSLMKLSMVLIMSLGHASLVGMAEAVLSPFESDPTLKLFVVMICAPVFMNVFQFWMVDNFIKRQGKGAGDDMSMGDLELDGSMRTRIQHGDM